MDVGFKNLYIKKIKLCLIFFCCISFYNCKTEVNSIEITVNYEKGKAKSISFLAFENVEDHKIFLNGNKKTSVLGEFIKFKNDSIAFIPVVPFENGQAYYVTYQEKVVGHFSIEGINDSIQPELIQIYPSKDTLPENLLKMYFVFSKPMQNVANFLDYIKVKNAKTTIDENIFLRLESELWNKDQTMITLWLDPGRIKTDLIPNKELGLPIKQGNSYILTVSSELRDAHGNKLDNDVQKRFYVSKRDEKIPLVKNWNLLSIPTQKTKDTLIIDFKESLDAILAKESLEIIIENKIFDGDYKLYQEERLLKFIPNDFWAKGNYKVQIDDKLEDLAGNNLLRKFDIDLEEKKGSKTERINIIKFQIE